MSTRILALILLGALTGCSTVSGWFGSEKTDKDPTKLVDFKQSAAFGVRWHYKMSGGAGNYVLQPAVTRDGVYVAGTKGDLARLDLATGKELWRVSTGFVISAGVTATEGTVLVGGEKGQLAAFAEDGKPLWKIKAPSEVLNIARIVDGVTVVRTADGKISGFSVADGKRLWLYEYATPALVVRSHAGVAIERETVFVGLAAGKLAALELKSGALVWETVVSQPRGHTELERISDITGVPVIGNQQVCAVAFQGRVACYSLVQGSLLWSHDLSSDRGMSLLNKHLFATNASGMVLALDRSSGTQTWKNEQLLMRQTSAPHVLDGRLMVGDYEGYLHVLSPEDGSMVARLKTDGSAIVAAPIEFSDGLLVQTQGGGLYSVTLR